MPASCLRWRGRDHFRGARGGLPGNPSAIVTIVGDRLERVPGPGGGPGAIRVLAPQGTVVRDVRPSRLRTPPKVASLLKGGRAFAGAEQGMVRSMGSRASRRRRYLIFFGVLGCAWQPETASSSGGSPGKGDDPSAGTVLLENGEGQNARFRGIGRLADAMSCTAFLVDNGGGADAPAYVLSNGHCASDWAGSASSVRVEVDRAPTSGATMRFDYFVDTPATPVAVKRIAFATMKGVDLSVVELATTRGELDARGILPLE